MELTLRSLLLLLLYSGLLFLAAGTVSVVAQNGVTSKFNFRLSMTLELVSHRILWPVLIYSLRPYIGASHLNF
jgi:hypothetical protein